MGQAKLIRLSQIVAGIFAAALVATFIWNISAYQAQSTLEARYHSQEHAVAAESRIARACVNLQSAALVECVAEQVEATREEQRAEYDLSAQNRMAEWAFWVMVMGAVTTGLTAVALYFVRETLTATREAVEDTGNATKAMIAANVIAAGVAAQGKLEQEARERENIPAVLVADAYYTALGENHGEFVLTIENVGRQAATDVYLVSVERFFMAEQQWYEERISISTAFDWLPKVSKDCKRRIGAIGVNPRTQIVPADFTGHAMRNCAYITGMVVYSDGQGRDYVSQFFYWLPDHRFVRGDSVAMISGSLRMATFKPYDGPELRDREGY